MSTENRISGNHLNDDVPEGRLEDMKNGLCIPNPQEHRMQHQNSWLTVTRLAPNILSGSTTSRITRCDWPNFHFRALFG